MIYEELEAVINNIFAARARPVSEKTIKVWAKEILSRNFLDQAIKEMERDFMEDDETLLTLPKIIESIIKHHNKIINTNLAENGCEWCGGRNYVYSIIFFAKNGKYLSQNYALKCFHNTNSDKSAKMVLNKETNNKTEVKTGYFLVFKDVAEREEYIEKVKANNWCDLWVKEDLGNKETEVVEITEEEEPDSLEEI